MSGNASLPEGGVKRDECGIGDAAILAFRRATEASRVEYEWAGRPIPLR
jgi:hypothetical protein